MLDYSELEDNLGREGDQRPSVKLRETPCLAVDQEAKEGQGAGVPGSGYEAYPLGLGEGGEEALQKWFSFSRGQDFDVEKGGLVLASKPKL